MLPNERTVALVLLALLLAQGLPVASAQGTPYDLEIAGIRTDPDAVFNQPTTVVLEIRNRGGATPQGGISFNAFVGDGSYSSCIDRQDDPIADSDVQAANGCEVRVTNANFAASETKTYRFQWTPKGTQQGAVRTFLAICSGTSSALAGNNYATCVGPESSQANDARVLNNRRSDLSVFVAVASVDAVAVRKAPPHTGANIDSAWREANITAPCDTRPGVAIQEGCVAQPGQTLLYEYNVTNLGNKQDAVRLDVVGSGLGYYLERGYRFVLSTTVLTLPPANGTKTVTLTVEVPQNATYNDRVNVNNANTSLLVTSGLDPTESTSPNNPPLPSLRIGQKFGLLVTTNDTVRIANATERVTYNLTLNNTGNANDEYRLTWKHGTGTINGSWELPAMDKILVPALSTRVIELSLRPPLNASKGIHTIDIELQSSLPGGEGAFANFTVRADLQQHYKISGEPDVGLLSRLPGDTASFVYRIRNDGNGYDNVTLEPSVLPSGWTGGLSSRVVMVPPFSTVPVWLNVTVPPNAAKGTQVSFFVNGTASGPTDRGFEQRAKIAPPLETQVRVLEGSNLDVQGGGAPAFVDPGQTVNYTLRVTNTGNVRDTFNVTATADKATWGAGVSPHEFELQPLESREVVVTVRAPAVGAVGETATVLAKVKSKADVSLFRDVSLGGRVSGPDLFVEAVNLNSTSPYAGDPLEAAIVFGNSGNKAPAGNVTLRVLFLQGGAERVIAERTYTPQELPGGIRRTERFVWNDTLSAEGAGVILARIDPEDEVEEIEEGEASNDASSAVTLRTFDIRVVPAQGLTGRPGEKVSYSQRPNVFLVTYRGNQPSEPVKITVESENGWGRNEIFVNLLQDTELEVLAEVQIPLMPFVPSDTLRVTVVPTLRSGAALTASATTTVLDEVKPRIGGITITPDAVKFGESVNITALVSDATGLRSVRAFVVSQHNESRTIPLVQGEGDAWSATASFTAAGVHRVYVEAIDGSNNENVNSTRDTVVSFNVLPGSAPVIKLADGQSKTIRTGGLIRLNVTDPLGIATATYTIRGIEYALASPYHIDTASFPAGPVNLSVKAANVYGIESTERFDLIVDNAPPGIRAVSVTPENPKVNEDVVVRIETDPTVQSVDVVLKLDGQVLETRAATKKSDGVFELVLNPGEGEYVVDVSARDSAGNVQLKQDALVFSAKPASLLPAPGVAVAALALAVVALALRRRRS